MWGGTVSVYYKSMLHLIHVVLFTLYNSNCLLLAQTELRGLHICHRAEGDGKTLGRLFHINCTCARMLT